MKRTLQTNVLAALILCLAPAAFAQEDIVVKAMRDEMNRSMKKLQLENFEKPYFLSYTVVDTESAGVSASFGSLNSKAEPQRGRFAKIQLRVGDYKFDNTNFFSASFSSGVSRGFGNIPLPLDDNYDEIRRQLWLATDSAYKKALEDLSKKRALLANKNRGEVIPDFTKEAPVTISDLLPEAQVKTGEMENLVRDLSALFRQADGISTSVVRLDISNEYSRYINSEGASTFIRQPEVQLIVSTSSQAADGQPLSAGFAYRARSMSGLPPRADIEAKIRLRTKQIADLQTEPLPERYAGPVLFEGEAAAEIVYRAFMPHILATPEVLVDNPQYRSMVARDGENLVEKIGLRVLPEFLSLADDPTATASGKTRLLGTHKVDDEGVPSRRMQIVENGLLMKLLTGRAPVLGIPQSSGSFHSGGVTPSNVIVTSSKSLPLDQLRAELLRRAKIRGKDYAIIVRKIDFSTRSGDSGGLAPGSLPVLLAYKRFADGHEEPMRNAIINGINFASFKDILAVSDAPEVLTMSYSARSTNPFEPAGSTFVSLVVPALMFEDATVQRPTGNVNKPPIVERPKFSKR
jgi:hypothetical protein